MADLRVGRVELSEMGERQDGLPEGGEGGGVRKGELGGVRWPP